MEYYNKEKVLEIYNNLLRTYQTMSERKVLISKNKMFQPTRASKAMIKRKIDDMRKKYKL